MSAMPAFSLLLSCCSPRWARTRRADAAPAYRAGDRDARPRESRPVPAAVAVVEASGWRGRELA
jgi:hypothetical protein